MLLYLIRHGETDWNVERRCQGFSDIPLNETGRRQADAIARHLSDVDIGAIYSSSLSRASEMAEMIAKYHDASVQMKDGLRELNQGAFEGLTLTELAGNHSDFLAEWFKNPADLQLPSGESMRKMQTRAWSVIEEIVEGNTEGHVVAVSHNLCILSILCQVMKMDLSDFRRIHQDVAALNILEFGGRWPHPVVLCLNGTSHLE